MKNTRTFKRAISVIMIGLFVGMPITAFASSDSKNITKNGSNTDCKKGEGQKLYTTDWLRVRAYPSLNAEILDVQPPYTEIECVGYDGEWVKAWYNDQVCYMHSDYLTMFNDEKDYTTENNKDEETSNQELDYESNSIGDENNCNDTENYSYAKYTSDDFYTLGIISWNDYRFTWYSENVLPGGGLDIDGRHSDENGYICDGDDYICLASDSLEKGTIVDTPFGKKGKVYDCGCGSDDILDVYVNW